MAQQMRIRDQEIIVKKVVEALKEKGLQDLETRFGNDSDVKFIQGQVKDLSEIKERLHILDEQRDELETSIRRGVEDFNTANDLTKEAGLRCSLGYRWNKDDTDEVDFQFGISWSEQSDIKDELAMQTIGTDFNVKDLIANLIAQFSK
tara:strand:- start:13 stop:456 length:444 start_codon:yes stop_codon:yes gene_type:complete